MTNMISDNGVDRAMTKAEIEELEKLRENAADRLEAEKQAEAAKEAAKTKLEALGLNLDDLKALGL
jgi:hypothetical protein